ncbi:MAG: hypothetical protein ACLSA6_06580 [Holdemania massiliensis]
MRFANAGVWPKPSAVISHGTTKPNIVLGQTGYDGDCDACGSGLKKNALALNIM